MKEKKRILSLLLSLLLITALLLTPAGAQGFDTRAIICYTEHYYRRLPRTCHTEGCNLSNNN